VSRCGCGDDYDVDDGLGLGLETGWEEERRWRLVQVGNCADF
jgi:hypothetical protein